MQVSSIEQLPTVKRTRSGKYSDIIRKALTENIRVECADAKEAAGLLNSSKRFAVKRVRESSTVVCLGPQE
jgi:hypothetical protein